jgi:uncharacterized protein YraI
LTPVDGITSTEVNVRAEPSTASQVLGVIPAEARIEIIGQDPGGDWWRINYLHPQAGEGKGWVSAAFVQTQGAENLPIVAESGQIVGTGTPTAVPHRRPSLRRPELPGRPDRQRALRASGHADADLQLEIVENTLPLNPYIKRGDPMNQIAVDLDTQYLVHIHAAPSAETLQYTNYILTIKTRP